MPQQLIPEEFAPDLSSKTEDLKRQLNQRIIQLDELNEKNGLLIHRENTTTEQEQTNIVFNSLGKKIADTCKICLEAKETKEEYQTTAKVLLQLLESIGRVGDGSIGFHHLERKETASGNKVVYFESDPFFIDNVETSMIVQVRPIDDFIDIKGKQILKAQARTSITIKSTNLPHGEAGVRIDPPDKRLGNNIVYDISVGRQDQKHATIIDTLDLDQKAGHHFPSGIRLGDLRGVKVEDVHRTVIDTLEGLVK